jgi:tetratricopeptide (TPR) repeat protein
MKSRIAEKDSVQLKQLFAKNPDSLLFSRVADLHRKEGNIKHAIEICQKGLEDHPEYVTGRIILGRCYIEQENYNSAIDEFIAICKVDRRNHVAIKMLADIFVKRGETEKAGDLYRILTQLDPFDTSFKILASRFDTTGKNDLLDILGIQSPAGTAIPEYSAPSEPKPEPFGIANDYSEGENDFSDNSIDQMLSSFTEENTVSDNNTIDVTGADIDNRMNSLFGEEEQASSNPVPTGFKMESNIRDESDQIPDESTSIQQVSGKDISSRIDELFDIPESKIVDIPDARKDGITEKIYLNDHFPFGTAARVVSEEPAADDSVISEIDSVSDHTVNEAISDKIIPFASSHADSNPINDEFEETLQFDRSMFSRLNDEPDYEELATSSPFMAMGKTEELYHESADEPEDEHSDVSINELSHSDDASVQYELQSLNYDSHDEELAESKDKSSFDNVHLHSPLSSVTEDTVFHGNDHFGDFDNEDVIMAESDDESSGFLNADNFTDKMESIFGDNETKDPVKSENITGAGQSDEQSEYDALLSINNIVDSESMDDPTGNLTLQMPDFDAPELPDITDSMTIGVSEAAIDDDISGNCISDEECGNSESRSKIIKPEDDLMSFQSESLDDAADTDLPGGDLFVNTLSELKLTEESIETDSSDSELISSGESLMLFQDEDPNGESVTPNDLTNDDKLSERNELDIFMKDSSDERKSSASDDLTYKDDLLQSLQSGEPEDSGLEGIRSAIVEDIPDIFNDIPKTADPLEDAMTESSVNPILEITNEGEDDHSAGIYNDEYLDGKGNEVNSIFVQDQEMGDVKITDTGLILSESVTDLIATENSIQDEEPVLLLDNDSDIITVESDESVVSDMDVLVVSPENEQMTGDDVAEKIQDIFELAESRENKQYFIKEDPVKLIEDDQEYTLDNISGTDNPAMIDLSDETFVENKGDYTDDVIDPDNPVLTDASGLILDSEPEETFVISNQDSWTTTENEGKKSPVQQDGPSLELPGSESQYSDERNVGRSGHSGTDELIIEDSERSQVISGSDVEERLNEFFGKDFLAEPSVDSLMPEDEEVEETLIQDFYTLSGENTATAGNFENLDGVDNVELDHTFDLIGNYENKDEPERETIINSCTEKDLPESVSNENVQMPFDDTENEQLKMSDTSEVIVPVESDILPEMIDEENRDDNASEKTIVAQENSERAKPLDAEELPRENIGRFSAADLFDDENTVQVDVPVVAQSFENGSDDHPVQDIDERDIPYTIPDHVLTPTLADIYFQQGQFQLALQIYSRLFEKDPDNDKIQSRIIEIKTCIEQNHFENVDMRGNHGKVDQKPLARTTTKENLLKNDSRPLAGVRISKKKKIKREQRKKNSNS